MLSADNRILLQVFEDEIGRPIRPRRHPSDRNTLSRDHWPLEVLPRFATGPHYILSRYCVEFIASNRKWLRGVGTLEDVSMAVWMLGLQVRVCGVVMNSFGDVSPRRGNFTTQEYVVSMCYVYRPLWRNVAPYVTCGFTSACKNRLTITGVVHGKVNLSFFLCIRCMCYVHQAGPPGASRPLQRQQIWVRGLRHFDGQSWPCWASRRSL